MALSWPYNQTQEEIQARIAARMGDTASVQEGTFGDLISRAAAYEIWRFYEQMRKMLPIAFVDETSGEYLEARCAEYGIERKAAGTAEVVLTFTGTAGAVIPAGTAAATASGLEFDTLAAAEIGEGGTVEVTAQAVQPGAAYNVAAGRITRLLTSLSGVSAVSNLNTAAGGYDEETDAALFARLAAFRKEPATSGNIYQYEQWALEVEGVGAARAIDLWDGPGTVKVVLAGNGLEPVDETVRAAAEAHIGQRRGRPDQRFGGGDYGCLRDRFEHQGRTDGRPARVSQRAGISGDHGAVQSHFVPAARRGRRDRLHRPDGQWRHGQCAADKHAGAGTGHGGGERECLGN